MKFNSNPQYKYQTSSLLQAAPVQNTDYTILDTTENCIIYQVAVNIEDTNETLDLTLTIDGETTITTGVACDHSNSYYLFKRANAITRVMDYTLIKTAATATDDMSAYIIMGKSIKIEVSKTTAAGAGNLTGIVIYGQRGLE